VRFWIKLVRVEITLVRVEITLCVWKSHSAGRNHTQTCPNHTHACENHTRPCVLKKWACFSKNMFKIDTHACEFHTQTCHFHTFACWIFSTRNLLLCNWMSIFLYQYSFNSIFRILIIEISEFEIRKLEVFHGKCWTPGIDIKLFFDDKKKVFAFLLLFHLFFWVYFFFVGKSNQLYFEHVKIGKAFDLIYKRTNWNPQDQQFDLFLEPILCLQV
jgi:hypothetical protein